MRRTVSLLLSYVIVFVLTACGQFTESEKQEEIQPAVQKTDKQSGTLQNGTEKEKYETEEQSDTETKMETELSESVLTEEREADVSTKILVVYFSCTGTTELVAEYITEILGADIYGIVPENPYTEADLSYYTNSRADQEQNDPDMRPVISGDVENMEEYDTIILGYPIWHGQAPRIISTFLESYDFSGKIIIPFCTSHSSGIGSSASDLHVLCSESAVWADGKRFEGGASKESIVEWITKLELNEAR
ncbi:MAG: flavodoxin [Lachnospiraceae bacterium]|nr:flavodoxin [Lachnospiraceae bacterium]MDE7201090.1 flavodoxin [Lachnospiraceae bacterium]